MGSAREARNDRILIQCDAVSQLMTNPDANIDESIETELPSDDDFVDAVARELHERERDDVASWTLENHHDMAALGPREVAQEEGIAADPNDSNAVDHVAETIELGYGDHMTSVKAFEESDE